MIHYFVFYVTDHDGMQLQLFQEICSFGENDVAKFAERNPDAIYFEAEVITS